MMTLIVMEMIWMVLVMKRCLVWNWWWLTQDRLCSFLDERTMVMMTMDSDWMTLTPVPFGSWSIYEQSKTWVASSYMPICCILHHVWSFLEHFLYSQPSSLWTHLHAECSPWSSGPMTSFVLQGRPVSLISDAGNHCSQDPGMVLVTFEINWIKIKIRP